MNPKLPDLLERFQQATGLSFTLDDNLALQEPAHGSVQFKSAPVFSVLEMIATVHLLNGRWVKCADGYQLQADVSQRQREAPAPSRAGSFLLGAVIGISLVLPVVGMVVVQQRNRTTATAPTVSTEVANMG